MDILDQEAHENETLLSRQPQLSHTRSPSHVANNHLIAAAAQYEATIKQAASSDATVKKKWDEWSHLIDVLAGGEVSLCCRYSSDADGKQDAINDHVPSTTASSSTSVPSSVRPLRASLEDLDDRIALRARLISEARQIAEADDVRPQVLQEASRLAHGGSGDVKTEWFEELFGRSIEKYDRLRDEMATETIEQDKLLERIRVSFFSSFRRYPSSRCRSRTTPSCPSEKMILV
jgi:programmed cell death 6-interacting protein